MVCGVALGAVADTKETVTINGIAVDKFVTQFTFSGSDVVLSYDDKSFQTVAASSVSVDFTYDEGDATAITDIVGKTTETGSTETSAGMHVYNFSGQRVADTTTNLPKGVYIIQNKKVLIQ